MTTVFDATALDSTDDSGFDGGVTFRCIIGSAALTAASGIQAQVVFRSGTSSGTGSPAISGAWIGQAASAGSINFTGNQVQLKFGGSATFNVTAASQNITSDLVTLGETFDNTKDYIVSWRMDPTTGVNVHLTFGTMSNVTVRFLASSSAGEEALTTASGGYGTDASTDQFVRQIFITGDTLGGAMPILMMSRRRRDPVKTFLLPSKYRRWTRGFALAA